MMISSKKLNWLAGVVICSLFLAGGCAPITKEGVKPALEPQTPKAVPAEEAAKPQAPAAVKPPSEPEKPIPTPRAPAEGAVTLALKFNKQDSTNYRVVTESERSVNFKGSLAKDSSLTGGRTSSRVEMTFNQQIQNVDSKGNAVAKITIDGLKYLSKVRDGTVMDFDSSKEQDQSNPLNKLVGQSYTIEIAPTGEVSKVDASQAQAAVGDGSPANQRALSLVSPETIRDLLTVSALPDTDKRQLHEGDSWNRTKNFSFGMMGSKSYERVYTVKEIKDTDNHRTAVVEMSFLPASPTAEQLQEGQQTDSISDMFDSTETYTGMLKLDLTSGKIEQYFEKLQSEWVIVDPQAEQKNVNEPDALIMGVVNLHSLEKID